MRGNLKRTSVNPLNPLGTKNKDLGPASHTLLTPEVNPLSPKSDQHEISPHNTNALE